MKKTISRITLFLFLSLIISSSTSAQWWNLYGPGDLQETIETVNGDLVAGGSALNTASGLSDGLVLRTDSNGNELWRMTFPATNFNSYISKIDETIDGDLLVAYNHFSASASRLITLYKISNSGAIIWERPMQELDRFSMGSLLEHPETQDIIISAGNYYDDFATDSLFARIILLNESGALQFQTEYQTPLLPISNFFTPILRPVSNGYIMGLGENIYRLNHSLSELWSQSTEGYEPIDLLETEEGDFICASVEAYDIGGTNVHIFKFDENGIIAWDLSFFWNPADFLKIIEKPNQTFQIIYKNQIIIPFPISLVMTEVVTRTISSTGELGAKTFLPATFRDARNVTQTDNDDLVFMGSASAFPNNTQTGFLLRTDCEISGFDNILAGQVYVDENFDCNYDSTEQLLANYPIQLVHQNGIVSYGMSDNNGQYLVNIGSGNFQASAIPQSSYEIPCTPQIINFNISDTTILADLPIQHIIECPQMTVSIGAPFLRRCFENTYTVRYCNDGTIEAEEAYLEILLDSFTVYENASIPPTSQNGSLLIFDLGDVPTRTCETFTITTTLSCDAQLGQNHCVEAHIYPDSICLVNSPEWDGSSIQVSAECAEDSVRFFINNLGSGDMLAPLNYIVIQDEILFFQDDFQLNSGSSIQRSFPADGSTYRLEADQSNGHPGFSMPSATVEGCGTWPFAIGFFGYFPQDDNDSFIDIECQENIGSFDPNDKSAFPIGYGEQQVIHPNTMVEYKIRFQNTGTDTAFTVTILDTLSSFLDPTSLRMGAASHPYNWSLKDQGTLEIDFPNILLPDSTTNLVASNGFVKFKIGLKQESINLGFSRLTNKAAIYFDFNEPVITNQVFHTLDTNFVDILLSFETIPEIYNRIKIAPNPVREQTTLTFPEDSTFPMMLKIYSQTGQLVKTQPINNITTDLDLERFPAGIYFYGVYNNQGIWASGKLVVQ